MHQGMGRREREEGERSSNGGQAGERFMFPRTIVMPKFKPRKGHLEPMKEVTISVPYRESTKKPISKGIRLTSKKTTFMLNEIKRREVVHEATIEEEEDSGNSKSQTNQDYTREEGNVSEIDQLTTKHIMLPKIKELKSAIAKIVIRDCAPRTTRRQDGQPVVKLGEAPLSERVVSVSRDKSFERSRTVGDQDNQEDQMGNQTDRVIYNQPNVNRRIWRHKLPEPPAGFPYRQRYPINDTRSLSIESNNEFKGSRDSLMNNHPKRNYLIIRK